MAASPHLMYDEPAAHRVDRVLQLSEALQRHGSHPLFALDFSALFSAAFTWASNSGMRLASQQLLASANLSTVRDFLDMSLPTGTLVEMERVIRRRASFVQQRAKRGVSPGLLEEVADYVIGGLAPSTTIESRLLQRIDPRSLLPAQVQRRTTASTEHPMTGLERLQDLSRIPATVDSYPPKRLSIRRRRVQHYVAVLQEYGSQLRSHDANEADAENLALLDELNRRYLDERRRLAVLVTDTRSLFQARDSQEPLTVTTPLGITVDLIYDPIDVLLLMWWDANQSRNVSRFNAEEWVDELVAEFRSAEARFTEQLGALQRPESPNLSREATTEIIAMFRRLRTDVRARIDAQASVLRAAEATGHSRGRSKLHRRWATTQTDLQLHQHIWLISDGRSNSDLLEVGVHFQETDLSDRYYSYTFPCFQGLTEFARVTGEVAAGLHEAGDAPRAKEHNVHVNFAPEDKEKPFPHQSLPYDGSSIEDVVDGLSRTGPLPLAIRVNGLYGDFWFEYGFEQHGKTILMLPPARAGIITRVKAPKVIAKAVLDLAPNQETTESITVDQLAEEIMDAMQADRISVPRFAQPESAPTWLAGQSSGSTR